ncbi:MAG: triose-phosphate isomerase family protein [Patescibacteria group bacterium]
MKYFVANWKANKTFKNALSWMDEFLSILQERPVISKALETNAVRIVICPPSPFIYPLAEKAKGVQNIFFGAQDISKIESGTYTGEVTADNLSEITDYVIIGHSERKKHFAEDSSVSMQKYRNAHRKHMKTFYCISGLDNIYPVDADFLCWEPVESISTGDGKGISKSVLDIISFRKNLKRKLRGFIYGGSVNEDNIKQYLDTDQIDGFLIGGASLDAKRFSDLLSQI